MDRDASGAAGARSYRRRILSISGALTASALAGCLSGADSPVDDGEDTSGDGGSDGADLDESGPSTDDADEPDAESEPDVDDERLAELTAGNADFALDLHQHLAAEEGGNVFVSPYSVSVALAMTYAGAASETREQMEATLQYTLGEDVHPAFADLAAALEARETTTDEPFGRDEDEAEEVDAFQLEVANSLWGREGFEFDDDYLDVLDAHYGAGLRRADFAGDPDAARERINGWVADATEDRIEDLLPAGALTPQTVLVLANAVYFLASWLHEFDPADTEEGTFTALDGSTSTVPFMHQNVRTNYASLDGVEALELPYVGEEVSMVLLLPEEGTVREFERSLDAQTLFEIFDELGDARGDVVLPRFQFRTEVQLSEALSEMGMPAAFEPGANFEGMVPGDGANLWIDEAYHEGFVAVDEQGTEAAASTAVVTHESAPPDWGELRFDRPFCFCIRDRPTDAVLFLGRVVDGDAIDDPGPSDDSE